MVKVLILLSHPTYRTSRANRALVAQAVELPGVEVVHLDELYPDGRIDTETEVSRLIAAESLVWQFPLLWYSTPPLLKAWQDTVLTRMFYTKSHEGEQIANRPVMVAATVGNHSAAYSAEGRNLYSLMELLTPLHATANRCGLSWQEPFIMYQASAAADETLARAGRNYQKRLISLRDVRTRTNAPPRLSIVRR